MPPPHDDTSRASSASSARPPTELLLLERDAEQHAIAAALDAAAVAEGRVLAITGAPGLGKTGLLAHARRQSIDRGFDVLTATASPLERDLAHGVTRQLLVPAVRALSTVERDGVLDRDGAAAELLLGRRGTSGGAAHFHLLDSLYWVLAALAERAPVALLVDDVHWADDASLRWLDYLSRRLDGVRVALAVALRPVPSGPAQGLVDRLAAGAHTELRPAPLGLDACEALARRLHGEPTDARFAIALHRATGGNPLLVHEVLRSMRAAHTPSVPELHELAPHAVARTVRLRLDGQPAEAVALARAAAVLGDGAPLSRAVRLAGLDPAAAYDALGVLAVLDVLAAGQEVRFHHPVVRDALLVDVSPAAVVEEHRRAAALLVQEGATPGEVAQHLVLTAPAGDPQTVDRLLAAAAEAGADGDHGAAVRLLRRALAEPPPPDRQAEVLWAVALADLATDAAAARRDLGRLAELERDAGRRAEAALLQAAVQLSDDPAAAESIAVEAVRARSGEVLAGRDLALDRGLRATAELAALLRTPPRPLDAAAPLLEPVAPEEPGGAYMAAVGLYRAGLSGTDAGKVRDGAEELLGVPRSAAALAHAMFAAIALVATDAPSALTLADRWLVGARAWGSAGAHGAGQLLRADAHLARGDLADAAAAAEAAIETFAMLGIGGTGIGYARALLVAARLEQGDLAGAAAVAADAERDGLGWGTSELVGLRRLAPSILAATGAVDDARAAALELGEACDGAGVTNPALVPWRSEAALLGWPSDPDGAAALAQEELELARRWGSARAVARALRVAGWVRGDEEELKEAERTVEGTPFRLERARCAIARGMHHRRRGRLRAARGPLAKGAELADLCGAEPLVRLAREELIAAGARPRRRAVTGADALTAREARTAELAAEGRSNREIAQALFVTQRTVELHLSNAYRKLGIATRGELAGVLGPGGTARSPAGSTSWP